MEPKTVKCVTCGVEIYNATREECWTCARLKIKKAVHLVAQRQRREKVLTFSHDTLSRAVELAASCFGDKYTFTVNMVWHRFCINNPKFDVRRRSFGILASRILLAAGYFTRRKNCRTLEYVRVGTA
ncbi:MAG TPA: hypothetical protein VKM55_17660 [Candidatus Lokiarchaeia archaeon]|nr:hypothetical protein [Candidatus Lokiarchaeia archaeon]